MRRTRLSLLLAVIGVLVTSCSTGAAWAAVPSTVPFAAAPKAEISRGFPTCDSSDKGLPSRAGFENAAPSFRRDTAGESYRTFAKLSERGRVEPSHEPLGMTFLATKELSDGRVFWYLAKFRNNPVPPLRTFVATFRTELGFRDGDWPEFVGKRVFRRYANGAISLRYLGAQYPELPYEEKGGSERVDSYLSLLPPPADGLASPPDLTGEQALATVHDMNPYLELLPLEELGRPLAARLVVVSGVDWDPRLAWEVRYRFSCWESGEGKEKPYLVEDSAYAYVDARAGSLVFGRDTTRGGAMLHGPTWNRPYQGCIIDLESDTEKRAPKATPVSTRRR